MCFADMDAFDAPDSDHIATFQTDELTALCPFDFGGPDHYDVVIRYAVDELALESKSLKEWLEGQRGREATAEELAADLHAEIAATISPGKLYVRLEQARRGGISETVEVGDYELRR